MQRIQFSLVLLAFLFLPALAQSGEREVLAEFSMSNTPVAQQPIYASEVRVEVMRDKKGEIEKAFLVQVFSDHGDDSTSCYNPYDEEPGDLIELSAPCSLGDVSEMLQGLTSRKKASADPFELDSIEAHGFIYVRSFEVPLDVQREFIKRMNRKKLVHEYIPRNLNLVLEVELDAENDMSLSPDGKLSELHEVPVIYSWPFGPYFLGLANLDLEYEAKELRMVSVECVIPGEYVVEFLQYK